MQTRWITYTLASVLVGLAVTGTGCLIVNNILHDGKSGIVVRAGASLITGPLRVHAGNPRYFADPSGWVVYLAGAYDWNYAWLMSDDRASAYLDYLIAHKENYIRVPTNDPTFWTPSPPESTPFDAAYFAKLKSRVELALARGIYVQVAIFQWLIQPPFDDQAYNEAYARHVVDTVGMYDNVLFEVGNELDTRALDNGVIGGFVNRMVQVINEQQAIRGFTRKPVGISDFRGFCNACVGDFQQQPELVNAMLTSQADFIQPGWSAVHHHYPYPGLPVSDYGGQKVVIADSDHLAPYKRDHVWVWMQFTRGTNVALLDGNDFYPDHVVPDNPNDLEGAALTYDGRLSFGDIRNYAVRLDLARALPSMSVSSTGFALAQPGVGYLVYQPNSGAFTVNVPSGAYTVEWFHPTAKTTTQAGTVAGGSTITFTPPFSGDAILYLKRGQPQLPETVTQVPLYMQRMILHLFLWYPLVLFLK